MSAATKARNPGAAAAPDAGPANTVFAFWLAREPVSVPEVVTGEPETENIFGSESPTLVTVPAAPLETVQSVRDCPGLSEQLTPAAKFSVSRCASALPATSTRL